MAIKEIPVQCRSMAGAVWPQLRKGFYHGVAASSAMPVNDSELNLDSSMIISKHIYCILSFCTGQHDTLSPQGEWPLSVLLLDAE